MPEPFEDPRKADLRVRCRVAIDRAGYELLEDLEVYPLPPPLKGSIRGDLQSRDANGTACAYYLRPEGDRAVPQWLSNLASAARDIDTLDLYVVALDVSERLETSCKSARVGLLTLSEDDQFQHLVDPNETDVEQLNAAIAKDAREVRRRLENKLDLNRNAISDNFSRVNEITAGMSSRRRDQYIREVERRSTRWDKWAEEVSNLLDEAAATSNRELLTEAEQLLEKGADDGNPS